MADTGCHGSSLGDDRPPATTPATTPPIVAIGKHDLSFEAHSVQDLEALADVRDGVARCGASGAWEFACGGAFVGSVGHRAQGGWEMGE